MAGEVTLALAACSKGASDCVRRRAVGTDAGTGSLYGLGSS